MSMVVQTRCTNAKSVMLSSREGTGCAIRAAINPNMKDDMNYTVTVGNIGVVYDGPSKREAVASFNEYRKQSKDGCGKAGHEEVTLLHGDEVMKQHVPRLMVPSVERLSSLIRCLKKDIGDDFRAYDEDDRPGMLLTIGCSYDKSWSYQTGDNSYSGGAYFHRYWGVGAIYRNSNSRTLAKEIINDCLEQTW